ncbi:TniQ protein [Kribbella sp. VKM Ac-2527]|uniref:TniQ protein n=2 Tax=Kribbella caucasensis TaxID=2512215 RepID=A0A4V3C4X4_9ACTN|nr:TniQ protein [Kribbella sp. VKM Ac-2527]
MRSKLPPLPRRLPPVQGETTLSYVDRLAKANHLDSRNLIGYLNPELTGTRGLQRRFDISLDVLAAVTGIPTAHLAQALPEIRPQHPDLHTTGQAAAGRPNRTQPACRRCMAAKNIQTTVAIWAHPDHNICPRHHLWIGHGVIDPTDQVEVAQLPEIPRAQVRHRNLIRRHGRGRVEPFYEHARAVIDWSTNLPCDTGRWNRMDYFVAREQAKTASSPLRKRRLSLARSHDYAAYYPEVIDLLSILVSPYWLRIAVSDGAAEREHFYNQVMKSGLTNGTPALNRPLQKWIARQRDSQPDQAPAAGDLSTIANWPGCRRPLESARSRPPCRDGSDDGG